MNENVLVVVSTNSHFGSDKKKNLEKEIKDGIAKGFLIKDATISSISIIDKEKGTTIAYID